MNYFADDLIAAHYLRREDMWAMASRGKADDRLRSLVAQYHGFAAYYRRRARRVIDDTKPYLTDRYQLSLEVIYGLYSQIFELINPDSGDFTTGELQPDPPQVQAAIEDIVSRFRPVGRLG